MVEPETWVDAVVLTPNGGSVTDSNAEIPVVFSFTGQLVFMQTYSVTKIVMLPATTSNGTFYTSIIPDFSGRLLTLVRLSLSQEHPVKIVATERSHLAIF